MSKDRAKFQYKNATATKGKLSWWRRLILFIIKKPGGWCLAYIPAVDWSVVLVRIHGDIKDLETFKAGRNGEIDYYDISVQIPIEDLKELIRNAENSNGV